LQNVLMSFAMVEDLNLFQNFMATFFMTNIDRLERGQSH
jgi:hypothetical protein